MEATSTEISVRLIITRAYKESFGRIPTKAETEYWTPQKKVFGEILDANRAFLYSPGGAKDLRETVARALYDNSGGQPSDKQIGDAIEKYGKTKSIYVEM